MKLPAGHSTRAATAADVEAVHQLAADASIADCGEQMIEFDDIITDWASPTLDLAVDAVFVSDDEGIVGFAEIDGDRAHVDVHPRARARGIGAALIEWTEQRALERAGPAGEARIGQTVPAGVDATRRLFEQRRYEPLYESWVLRLPPDAELTVPDLPEGMAVRPYRPDEEWQVYKIVDDAFNEWEGRTSAPFEVWQTHTTGRAIFDPGLLLVATSDDAPIGVCLGLPYAEEGWAHQVAVVGEHRGKGVGRAMLASLFVEFRARGQQRLGLNTDSRTGALGMYLSVGMVVEHTFTRWSRQLR